MKTTGEHKVEQTLGSTDGMMRAEAPPFLYGKIAARLKQVLPEPVYYTTRAVVRLALALVLMTALNAITVKTIKKPGGITEEQSLTGIAREYFGSNQLHTPTY
jgi:hypothetical protein